MYKRYTNNFLYPLNEVIIATIFIEKNSVNPTCVEPDRSPTTEYSGMSDSTYTEVISFS